jgi:hypothetical protein
MILSASRPIVAIPLQLCRNEARWGRRLSLRVRDCAGLLSGETTMRQKMIAVVASAFAASLLATGAHAQEPKPLSAYADKDGWLNVQALTCAELAGTYQEDADMLTTWYSGWYNGLAKKHYINIPRAKEAEHEVIVHKDKKIIEAIKLVIDEYRAKHGIELAK